MATLDIRTAKFYVLDDTDGDAASGDVAPREFDSALAAARSLAERGRHVHVLYTDGASQMQLTELAHLGIPAQLASEG